MSAAVAAVSLPVAAFAVWALLRSPLARRLVSPSTGERWSEHATPAFGGVGIYLGLAAGIGAALAAGAVDASSELLGILAGATLLFVAGLVDDVRTLPPLAKLAAQGGAAAIVLSTGLEVEVVGNEVLGVALGVLWFVGMTNAFNLLDNMDGLAAATAGIAATFFFVDSLTEHPERLLVVVSLALAAACAGFLPFNFRPGKPAAVFMGDSGSQVLGFTLAALGLASSWKAAETTVATLVLPLLVLAVPILDTALVAVTRLVEGRPISRGGKDHTSHRLVRIGLSEKRAVVLLVAIAAGLGATSLTYSVLDDFRVTLVGVLITFALLVQFAGFLADLERGEAAPQPTGRRLVSAVLLHRRRLLEVLIDFALITASFYGAFLLVVEGQGTNYQRHVFTVALPVILVARYLAFIPLGLYNGVWRFAGAREAAAVVIGVVASEAVAFGITFASTPLHDFPARVFIVDALLCTLLVGASRFGERALFRVLATLNVRGTRRRTLVVGAGRSGRSLVRELRETPTELVIGFLDDDLHLHRRRLLGVPVRGGLGEVGRVIAEAKPDVVLVTIPEAPGERLAIVVAACEAAEIPCRFARRDIDLDPSTVLETWTR